MYFLHYRCLGRTTSEVGTLGVMGSTVKDKRQWQHPHQACSRKVQCGNNGASRKALIALFKVAIEAFQFSIFFNLLLRNNRTFCWHNFWYVRNSNKKLYGEADTNLLLRKSQSHPEKSTCTALHCTEHLSQMEFLSLSGLLSISDRSDNPCAKAWLAALKKKWIMVEQPTTCSVQLRLHWKMIKTKVAFPPSSGRKSPMCKLSPFCS